MTGAPTEPPLRLRAAVCSETGLRRRGNEDNFYLNGRSKPLRGMDQRVLWAREDEGCALYAVCDGMGGAQAGALASTLAVTALDAVAARLCARPQDTALALECLCQISRQTRVQGLRLGGGMGSTLVLALLHPGGLELYNLGDSRGYLLLDGRLELLSRDHTTRQSFLDMGLPPPGQNGLTQYLGMDEEEFSPEPHHRHAGFPPGARLLLCSDGLTGMVDENVLAGLLADADSPARAVRALTDAALSAGGRDNVTALAVQRLPGVPAG